MVSDSESFDAWMGHEVSSSTRRMSIDRKFFENRLLILQNFFD